MDSLALFSERFAERVGADFAFPFWKARVALYALLRAIGVKEGDEVIVPGYTCVMDVNPIFYVGATPRYADIDPVTYNVDMDSVRELVSDRTRAILAQHTYGIPAPMEELRSVAQSSNSWLIEDCCLALGARINGKPVGSFGDAAYWSFQWNKIFTTGIGGMATTSNPWLAERLNNIITEEAEAPPAKSANLLTLQRCIHSAFIWPKTSAFARAIFRYLSNLGLAIGSSDPTEFTPRMPDGFFMTMSPGQASAGLKRLENLEDNLAHRQAISRLYDQFFREQGWDSLNVDEIGQPAMVGYPVRVAHKSDVLSKAPSRMIELGSWFESPLHPYETPLKEYGYEWGICPNAEKACEQVVMLPTHPRVTEREAKRAANFLIRATQQANP